MKGFQKPHVVAVPFPPLGHSIPFLDLAKLLALQGAVVSYVTTPANASRLGEALAEAQSVGLDIRAVVLPTPAVEGLQEGRERADVIPSPMSFSILPRSLQSLSSAGSTNSCQKTKKKRIDHGRFVLSATYSCYGLCTPVKSMVSPEFSSIHAGPSP